MYNFVIFASEFYCYEYSYADVIGLDNVQYIPNQVSKENKILNYLHIIHHSNRINNYIKLPFKKIWFNYYFKNRFENDKPICFLFFSNWLFLEKYGFIKHLKRKYKNAKFVCFFQDLISLKKGIDIEYYKEIFDLLISFDHKEAEQYNLKYSPLVNSKTTLDLSSNLEESDVYFLGAAKNRFKEIISAYEILTKKNIKCDFYVTGVSKKDQKYVNDIHYVESMSYLDNLKHIEKSKCILEIMQLGGHGYTQRMVEAIVYNKKIITNNPEIKKAPFYNQKNILTFNDLNELSSNISFFENIDSKVDHHYRENISPVRLLEFITENLI